MLLKLVAIDVETGNFVFQEIQEGLPAGTVVGQLLRWNGTSWVGNDLLLSILSGSNQFLHLKASGDNSIDLGTDHWRIKQAGNILYFTDLSPAVNKDILHLRGGSFKDIKAFFPIDISYSSADATINKPALQITRGGTTTPVNTLALFINDGQALSNHIALILGHSSQYGMQIENGGVSGLGNGIKVVVAEHANNVLLSLNTTSEKLKVKNDGTIFSNSLTPNTYLGANANKEIVSIPSPNTIKYNTALIEDTAGNWTPVPTLTFSLEANVTYELELYLSLGNNAGRNGSIRIDTSAAAYTHRAFIIGNSNGANPAVIYINDSTATQPFNLDNSTEFQVQNADSGSVVMLKGIITSAVNIPAATIQIKTRDVGSAFQCKQYSYLKLSR